MDPQAFDNAIEAHGLLVEVHRAVRCPGGAVSRFDSRRPNECHLGCSNGFLYRRAGTVYALFTANSTQRRQGEAGVLANSSGNVTFQRFYIGTEEPVRVTQYDRLYLPNPSVLTETWQEVDHSPNGVDLLDYPAEQVVFLVSSLGRWFSPGEYSIQNGRIVWSGPNRPRVGPDGRGEVYSVRYLYRPFWYVHFQHHDLRFITVQSAEGVRATAVHQSVSVQREYFYQNESRDEEAPASPRQNDAPEDPPQFETAG